MTGARFGTLVNICGKHSCFVYIKPVLRNKNQRDAYMLLFDHFIGPRNVVSMASAADTKLTGNLYNGEKKRFTWECRRMFGFILNSIRS
jgi:hypothetical protein